MAIIFIRVDICLAEQINRLPRIKTGTNFTGRKITVGMSGGEVITAPAKFQTAQTGEVTHLEQALQPEVKRINNRKRCRRAHTAVVLAIPARWRVQIATGIDGATVGKTTS